VITTASSRPIASTAMCRLRPFTFFALSHPRLARGTVSAARTDWESMMARPCHPNVTCCINPYVVTELTQVGVASAIAEQWELPEPIGLSDPLNPGGTADTWLVTDGEGRRYVAKYAYAGRMIFESGLRVSGHVESTTDLRTGSPLPTPDGRLTTMLRNPIGRPYPLALLRFVEGRAVAPNDGLNVRDAARLLAKVHYSVASYPGRVSDSVANLENESVEVGYEESLGPIIRAAARTLRELDSITLGVNYGHRPEAIVCTDGSTGLIDWGSVNRAPLLWDVMRWSDLFREADDRKTFVDIYRECGPVPACEFEVMDQLAYVRAVHHLRFRAFRVLHSEQHHFTQEHDRTELIRLARQFGVAEFRDGATSA
jgi:hypothetical protein